VEKKGSIPEIAGALNNPLYIGMINELLTVFGRIKGGTSGQILEHDGDEFILASHTTYSLSHKIGSFTIDTTTATGTQAVTGVGFEPDVLLFLACQDNSDELSIGWDDGTTKGSLAYEGTGTVWRISTSYSIRDIEATAGGGLYYEGVVNSMDSGGFTIGWTRTGAPSGTLTIVYLALKVA
jgi:hypothetical protein